MADTIATANWQRYEYARTRGHREYCAQARRCERFYLGGGSQWDEDVKADLGEKLPAEINEILPAVNVALGHQIHNRMDIAFQPRSGVADQVGADVFSKVIKQIADANKLHWLESQVFADGMIQQRGYFDIRMDWSRNIFGDAAVTVPDPMDVIPDPDGKDYDPKTWGDVIFTRWLHLDEIEQFYGEDARLKVENASSGLEDQDFGDDGDDEERNKFGNAASGSAYDSTYTEFGVVRYRIIERQHYRYSVTQVALFPSGDVRTLGDKPEPKKVAELQQQGALVTRRRVKRVRWTVSTWNTTIHDDWSPYQELTIVPFFAYFRRGKTRGMIDNAISPQEVLNKAISQYIHIVNTSANSGYTVEEHSLTNMTTEELKACGGDTGLVLEYKQGAQPPRKIEPNQIPTGVDRLIDRAATNIKETTGISDALRGMNGPEVSGVAIQAKQHWGQQQLAVPLDNLARTRHMVAERLRDLVQQFYDTERVFRITSEDDLGNPVTEQLAINQWDPATGKYLNDLTAGEYDVVISEVPISNTWENSQFQQALEIRKVGVAIPDDVVVKYSTLSDKQEIVKRMASDNGDPEKDAKVELTKAQAQKIIAEATNKAVEAMFSATQAARNIASTPAIAPLADTLLRSAGYQDHDPAPIVPSLPAGTPVVPEPPDNTHPLTPTNPAVGLDAGIEGGTVAA